MEVKIFNQKMNEFRRKDNKSYAPAGNANLPLWKNIMAGGVAGMIEILVMYPTDVVKTRSQLQTVGRASFLNSFNTIIKEEGIGRLYRGIINPIMAEAPKRAVKFSANEHYKNLAMSFSKDGKLTSIHHVFTGAMAGATETFFNCPFEVIKVRMQAKENLQLYKNSFDALMGTIRSDGILGLYKGMEAQMWRNVVWNGAYFGMIGFIRNNIPKPSSSSGEKFHSFFCGVIGGTIATTLNTPLDVVKSRMQNVSVVGASKWTFPSLVMIYRNEGFKSLYKGYTARIVRLGPGGGIMLVAFDLVAQLLA